MAAVMALGMFVGQAAQPARGLLIDPLDPLPANPTIYSHPFCITSGGSQTIRLSGRNFDRNAGLTIIQTGSFTGTPPMLQITTDDYGVFDGDMTVSVDQSYYGIGLAVYYDANNESQVTSLNINGCSSDALVVATPNCGGPDSPSITVHGERFGAADSGTDITIQLTQGQSPVGEPLVIKAAETFDVRYDPGVSLAAGSYEISASQSYLQGEYYWFGYDTFSVPCPQVKIEPTCSPQTGSPPDQMTIYVTGLSGWIPGTADGYDEIEIVFDPEGEPQEFFWTANPYESEPGIQSDGSFATVKIAPYARPRATYTILVKQQGYGEDPVLDQSFTFEVPCQEPTLIANPPCGAPELNGDLKQRYAVTVSGAAFYPDQDVTVTFDPDYAAGSNYPPESFSSVVGTDGSFSVVLDVAYRPPGSYRIEAVEETAIGTFRASASFGVPCLPPAPTITLPDKNCGDVAPDLPAAYTVHVAGAGFTPGRVDIVFDPTSLLPETFSATADATGAFETDLILNGRAVGTYPIVASQTSVLGLLDEASIAFAVPCVNAEMQIVPPSGPRGFVTMVVGSNFPPLTTLLLHWDFGLGASQPITVQTDETGSFRRQVLIFRSDFTGLRHLTVEYPSDPTAYVDIKLDYLVTPSSVTPPFSIAGNPIAAPGATIVIRH